MDCLVGVEESIFQGAVSATRPAKATKNRSDQLGKSPRADVSNKAPVMREGPNKPGTTR